ncbi:hypothetical protein BC361_20005 [Ensifer sp. LC54]|nr:hypothetical protein BC361_20005 [Ensifer sp. LC54]OCP26120.1 hypothetical protein BC363_18530 [Ensifer sp. LC384]
MSAAQPCEQQSVKAHIHCDPTADCNDSLDGETQQQKTISRQAPVLSAEPRQAEATHIKKARRC